MVLCKEFQSLASSILQWYFNLDDSESSTMLGLNIVPPLYQGVSLGKGIQRTFTLCCQDSVDSDIKEWPSIRSKQKTERVATGSALFRTLRLCQRLITCRKENRWSWILYKNYYTRPYNWSYGLDHRTAASSPEYQFRFDISNYSLRDARCKNWHRIWLIIRAKGWGIYRIALWHHRIWIQRDECAGIVLELTPVCRY
jgi:hypothetical protein